ncbi:pentatricopeptide repeat-containing protein At4g39952, mitochondrial [Diospyros lotus]|uniref:pentatricopeptide repeat-containing protein At4g39952, mitochondrial n=1 Tax=Diospyros lotus TaxID=55363 RepID=UPI00224E71D4|nr:pentatricopeptide repeat-containing protein At4g39952, mitochondrial [Diospyros lotus]XP_052197697.1 pentatricopeptide repeat-containing protein At4g39952, mitochondrial [Diospyros lotus]XP_052197698.1 pentatricopeptide repeat-containing protein At4g39952, mitochondrial [Diospyros lotus]
MSKHFRLTYAQYMSLACFCNCRSVVGAPMLTFKRNYFYRRFYSSLSSHSTAFLDRQINRFLSIQTLDPKSVLQSHGYIITTGSPNNAFIASKLISLYGSINKPDLSAKVFDSVRFKDAFLWNSIIKAHFSNGNYSEALEFYLQMRFSGVLPNDFTFPMVVSACAELSLLKKGMEMHALVSKLGLFAGNSAVGSSFLYMYSTCGCIEDAADLFDEFPMRDVVAWTALVIGYVQNGESEKGLECFCEMHRIGGDEERPNSRTFEGGFQACGNLGFLSEGMCLQSLATKTGIDHVQGVQSSILSMYIKCGCPEEACLSFCEVDNKDVIAWTSVIGVYARLGRIMECIYLFSQMQVAGIYPDGIVISCLLSGFGNSMRVNEGKAFHGILLRRNYIFNQMVINALLSMYFRFGLFSLAEKLFDRAHDRDKETWNIMAFEYDKVGLESKCIELFREMQYLGIEYNPNGLLSVISSCSRIGANHLAQSLHCCVIKSLMHENISFANSLIDLYGKSGNFGTAWKIFCRTHKDTVTWNTLISSYVHGEHFCEALSLFNKMVSEGFKPNIATLVTLLSASSRMASLEKGEQIHIYIKEGGFEFNISLATALVDMYAKCGQLEKSREIFDSMDEKDVISWNVMISAYGVHGDAKSALEIFQQMERSDVKPNELTFLAVLSACTHAGLVQEGKCLFERMGNYSLSPTLKHYACMVDLLGRSGNLHEAEDLVLSMPIAPDGGLWGALLSACKIHNNTQMGMRIAKHAIEADQENDGYYVMIADMYTSLGKWEEAEKVRVMMQELGVQKRAGLSTV